MPLAKLTQIKKVMFVSFSLKHLAQNNHKQDNILL